jgi:hypothetical protein
MPARKLEVSDQNQIRTAVFHAIDRIRELSMNENGLLSQDSTVLLGEGALLDSMGFVNFVVALEEEITKFPNAPIDLFEMLSPHDRPRPSISTAGELINFLDRFLK